MKMYNLPCRKEKFARTDFNLAFRVSIARSFEYYLDIILETLNIIF